MHRLKKVTEQDRYGNKVIKEYEVDRKALDPTALQSKQMEMGVPQMSGEPPVMGEEFNMGNPTTHPGGPRGEDTVPAWLTPGEFVVNKEATQAFGPQIEAMNNVGRMMQGGNVPQYHWKGDTVKSILAMIPPGMPDAVAGLASTMMNRGGAVQYREGGGGITQTPWGAYFYNGSTYDSMEAAEAAMAENNAIAAETEAAFNAQREADINAANEFNFPGVTEQYLRTIEGQYPDPMGFDDTPKMQFDPSLTTGGQRDVWRQEDYLAYAGRVQQLGGTPMPYAEWAKEAAKITARRDGAGPEDDWNTTEESDRAAGLARGLDLAQNVPVIEEDVPTQAEIDAGIADANRRNVEARTMDSVVGSQGTGTGDVQTSKGSLSDEMWVRAQDLIDAKAPREELEALAQEYANVTGVSVLKARAELGIGHERGGKSHLDKAREVRNGMMGMHGGDVEGDIQGQRFANFQAAGDVPMIEEDVPTQEEIDAATKRAALIDKGIAGQAAMQDVQDQIATAQTEADAHVAQAARDEASMADAAAKRELQSLTGSLHGYQTEDPARGIGVDTLLSQNQSRITSAENLLKQLDITDPNYEAAVNNLDRLRKEKTRLTELKAKGDAYDAQQAGIQAALNKERESRVNAEQIATLEKMLEEDPTNTVAREQLDAIKREQRQAEVDAIINKYGTGTAAPSEDVGDEYEAPPKVADGYEEGVYKVGDKFKVGDQTYNSLGEANNAVTNAVNNNGDGTSTSNVNGQSTTLPTEKVDKVQEWLSNNLGVVGDLLNDSGLINQKALTRMAFLYVAQRAMGYSHGGSLQWAAGNYLNEVNAAEKHARELEIEKAKKQTGVTSSETTQKVLRGLGDSVFVTSKTEKKDGVTTTSYYIDDAMAKKLGVDKVGWYQDTQLAPALNAVGGYFDTPQKGDTQVGRNEFWDGQVSDLQTKVIAPFLPEVPSGQKDAQGNPTFKANPYANRFATQAVTYAKKNLRNTHEDTLNEFKQTASLAAELAGADMDAGNPVRSFDSYMELARQQTYAGKGDKIWLVDSKDPASLSRQDMRVKVITALNNYTSDNLGEGENEYLAQKANMEMLSSSFFAMDADKQAEYDYSKGGDLAVEGMSPYMAFVYHILEDNEISSDEKSKFNLK